MLKTQKVKSQPVLKPSSSWVKETINSEFVSVGRAGIFTGSAPTPHVSCPPCATESASCP